MIRSNNSGFVLLYALLVASIIAIGGALLSDIIVKQIILSGVGRDSQIAYYAASAGEECARYWKRNWAFGALEIGDYYIGPDFNTIRCNGEEINVEGDFQEDVGGEFNFILSGLPNNSCAKVSVVRMNDEGLDYIESLGYNFGNNDCDGASLRRVERRIIRSDT